MENTKEPLAGCFQALSRLCLNNWHYIDHRVLSFHQQVNFFTGHSGSGKSTVIDALQILLYANTDGRGFFNKAAADDSDRSLMEYLRGMVNIGEDNEYSYLRNRNFSSTIVMELKRSDNEECQCIGVAFDVEPATNEAAKLFFWHKGPLLEGNYRTKEDGSGTASRALTIDEIKERLKQMGKEDYYFGPSNERFRRQLYDIYLGGLNMDRFPVLFKRAIPFRMNSKLEDFVKEYICMEEDIRIEDMQESVMQYGRMRRRIGEVRQEIEALTSIRECFEKMGKLEEEYEKSCYFAQAMELYAVKAKEEEIQLKAVHMKEELGEKHRRKEELEEEIGRLRKKSRELTGRIASSGYEELTQSLKNVEDMVRRLKESRTKWENTARELKGWKELSVTPNDVIWDVERFEKGTIQEEELHRLKGALKELRREEEERKKETQLKLSGLKKQKKEEEEELKELRQGRKVYPRELTEAREYIKEGLKDKNGRYVPVEVLADLLEIGEERWRNAVEGYLGSNKFLLVVPPAYAKRALELYEELDKKRYSRVSVLDTENVAKTTCEAKENSLAQEVASQVPYVQNYINFLLGNVIKCETTDQLRQCRIGITSSCMVYHNFRLQHIHPDLYIRQACIGEISFRKRIRRMEERLAEMEEAMAPLKEAERKHEAILAMEALAYPADEYMSWARDISECARKELESRELHSRLKELEQKNISLWEEELRQTDAECASREQLKEECVSSIGMEEERLKKLNQEYLGLAEELTGLEAKRVRDDKLEEQVKAFLSGIKNPGYERLKIRFLGEQKSWKEETEQAFIRLKERRLEYLRRYPNRSFSVETRDNQEYDELLSRLAFSDLDELYKRAGQQANEAVQMFKQDFIYKIRSAIKDALERTEELNRIISGLDFGKDRYQFVIGKNKGPDGKYYDMFMDENLEINPSLLNHNLENQMDLFSMSHEEAYGEEMNELIRIFIPPENASGEELEEAKRNMERYADYRTYLSFDMQQIIQGEETIKIRLSKMIKKNSGGEGQNPLYVALLASFAQAYRIDPSSKQVRNPTIRLVVLDEAFSKMDAEKVASCIRLIRGLGFQAIISATNDKIQNYLENVDRTFVFANPNKKHISIQEFEKREFAGLSQMISQE